MTKYYIVLQSDTDENGAFDGPTRFHDETPDIPSLFISAEEARETVAKEVADCCAAGTYFSVNGNSPLKRNSWFDAYQCVMQDMEASGGQYTRILFSDGSERNLTIGELIV